MHGNYWPDIGDFVVCTVKEVVDFGAYTTLEEYDGKEGFIHISEVKAGWVKYVRDYVREGQKIVCKVLKVDPTRRHIDLSLKDVNEHQKRAKIQDWKNEQKASKWLQFVDEETKNKEDDSANLRIKLYENYGSLYSAFEEAALNGEETFSDLKLKKNITKSILRIAKENIKVPSVDIAGFVDLKCYLPDGIEVIKQALMAAYEAKKDGVNIEITYTGAPRYRIKVIAPDYKTAESVLKNASNAIINAIHKLGGQGIYFRHSENVKA